MKLHWCAFKITEDIPIWTFSLAQLCIQLSTEQEMEPESPPRCSLVVSQTQLAPVSTHFSWQNKHVFPTQISSSHRTSLGHSWHLSLGNFARNARTHVISLLYIQIVCGSLIPYLLALRTPKYGPAQFLGCNLSAPICNHYIPAKLNWIFILCLILS